MKRIIVLVLSAILFLVGCGSATGASDTQAATQDREPEIELASTEDTSLENVIPEIVPGPEEGPIPLGIPYPEDLLDESWTSKPLFLYTLPEFAPYIKEAYKLEGSDVGYILHVKNYWLEITFKGAYGPVWKFTSFSEGELFGVTPNHFVFQINGKLFYIEQESVKGGRKGRYEELPNSEKDYLQHVKEVDGFHMALNVQINDFKRADLSFGADGMLEVVFPKTTVSKRAALRVDSPDWYQFRDGRMFFIHTIDTSHKEAVFVGGIDGIMQVIQIPFRGEFAGADDCGIFYQRGERTYFKSFYPIRVGDEMLFPEIDGNLLGKEGIEFPDELKSTSNQESIPAELVAPF